MVAFLSVTVHGEWLFLNLQ